MPAIVLAMISNASLDAFSTGFAGPVLEGHVVERPIVVASRPTRAAVAPGSTRALNVRSGRALPRGALLDIFA